MMSSAAGLTVMPARVEIALRNHEMVTQDSTVAIREWV
jgi:hypothetical protein